MKKIISIILIILILALPLSACGNTEKKADGLSIVCTTFPQYDFLKNILGSDDALTLLLDDGADLHSYEPTAQDIIKIGSADLFVYIGGNSDKWVDGALRSANNPELESIALMDTVNTYKEEYVAGMEHNHSHGDGEIHGGDHSEEDEHIWLSVRNAAVITKKLCDAVCEIDSANAEIYKSNAQAYISELNGLDNQYQSVIDSSSRKVLLFADRFPFRYLIEDYNLTYHAAFAGCSSESEASFETMAYLIDKTKELSLPAILIIDNSDGSLAETVSQESGAKILSLDSCQSVSMADINQGVNYLDIMKSNLEVLTEALN